MRFVVIALMLTCGNASASISCADVVRCKKGTEFWNKDHTKGIMVVRDITMCEGVLRSKYFSPLGGEAKPIQGGLPPSYLRIDNCQNKGK